MKSSEGNNKYIIWFKEESEKLFQKLELDKKAYGLQCQKGTRWSTGLSEEMIEECQDELGFKFPEELKWFYKTMNGTNLQGVNVFGESGIEYKYEPILLHFA